jgi:hypothetical protein
MHTSSKYFVSSFNTYANQIQSEYGIRRVINEYTDYNGLTRHSCMLNVSWQISTDIHDYDELVEVFEDMCQLLCDDGVIEHYSVGYGGTARCDHYTTLDELQAQGIIDLRIRDFMNAKGPCEGELKSAFSPPLSVPCAKPQSSSSSADPAAVLFQWSQRAKPQSASASTGQRPLLSQRVYTATTHSAAVVADFVVIKSRHNKKNRRG